MENISTSIVKLNIGNQKISLNYLYNKSFTFIDLLEYISYLFPNFEICPCFKFRFKQNNNKKSKYIDIPSDSLISDFTKYLNDLYLDDSKKYCFEHKSKNYFKYSKTKLISSFEDDIAKLEYINKKRKNEINLLEKDKIAYTNELEDLKKKKDTIEFQNYLKENNNLKLEINYLNRDKKEQEMKIIILIRDKNLLELAINGDIEKIKLLNHLGVERDNLKKTVNLNQKYIKEKSIDFYDVIVHIDSIKNINKGWKVELSEKAEKQYELLKSQKSVKIGVLGNMNKGKSFLLSKLCTNKLPSGTSIRTDGLSIKYPHLENFGDKNIVLINSVGTETPVLNLDNQNYIDNDKINDLFKEKLITELFLQNYIISNSDILIIVVGLLTYSEQRLLMKVEKEIEKSKINLPLFIIHNLITFTKVQQVQNYIDDFLLKSATFNLEEGHIILTKTNHHTGIYFYQNNKDQKIINLL